MEGNWNQRWTRSRTKCIIGAFAPPSPPLPRKSFNYSAHNIGDHIRLFEKETCRAWSCCFGSTNVGKRGWESIMRALSGDSGSEPLEESSLTLIRPAGTALMGKCERFKWPDLLTIYEALVWGCTVALEYLLNELYTERNNTSHKLICDALLS